MQTELPFYVKKVMALLPVEEKQLQIPKFRYFIGNIRSGKPHKSIIRADTDTIILIEGYEKYITGIRTYKRHPIFEYVFAQKKPHMYLVRGREVDNIIQAFELVYKDLNSELNCYEADINNQKHVLLLNTYPITIAYNFDENLGVIYESRDIKWVTKTAIDEEQCTNYRETLEFDYFSYPLTVKEYLLGTYLLQYLFLIGVYEQYSGGKG